MPSCASSEDENVMNQMCTSISSLFEHVGYKHAATLTRAKNDGNRRAILLPGFPRYYIVHLREPPTHSTTK